MLLGGFASASQIAPDTNVKNRFLGADLALSATQSGIGGGAGFGVQAGQFFGGHFGVGAYLRNLGLREEIGNLSLGVKWLARLQMEPGGITLGLLTGVESYRAGNLNGSTQWSAGVAVHWEKPLKTLPFSLGASFTASFSKPGDTVLSTISPALMAKWWI